MFRRLPPRTRGLARRGRGRERRADERLDSPRGGARDPVQSLGDDDAVSPLQRLAVQRARGVQHRRQRPNRIEPGLFARSAARGEPRPGARAGCITARARRGPRAAPVRVARLSIRRRLDGRGRPCRPPHHDARRRRCRARPRRRVPAAHSRDGDRARAAPRGPRRPHDRREDRDRPRRERRRGVGAPGRRDGWRPSGVGPGRPPARPDAGGPGRRDTSRKSVLPRHRQPRLRQGRGRRDAHRRIRAEPDDAVERRRAVGPRRQSGRVGHGPVRAVARGRDQTLPHFSRAPASSGCCAIRTR